MIIVTGSKGFIGSELVQYLQDQGKQVHAMDWDDRGRTWTASEPIEWIFHLGAISETNEKDWNTLVKKNIESTQEWIQFANDQGCGITYASSGSIYGSWVNSPEWGPLQPQHLYGVSKLAIDNWCAVQNFKVPVQGMRFFNVYGRNEGHKIQPSPIRRYMIEGITKRIATVWHHNGRLGARDFVSVDDCISAMMQLKDAGVSGVFNIGTGVQLSFEDIARLMQKYFGISNCQVHVVPMPDHMIPSYQWESQANLDRLKQVLPDWNPTTVDEWLAKNFTDLYNKTLKELK
jgi:ADP-L-glycero-D-manno-heptose 6-epimerase